jgi:serine/threonine protein kinase
MHRAGYVHGDIRAFNMVLNYHGNYENDPFGKLIDFDYGGIVRSNAVDGDNDDGFVSGYINPKYPSSYNHSLVDGHRLGRPGKLITVNHDWYALGHVIFDMYKLVHRGIVYDNSRENQSLSAEVKLIKEKKTTLYDMQDNFLAENGDYTGGLPGSPYEFLSRYLTLAQAHGFELSPTDKFRDFLKDCKMIENERIDSNGATGSPPKQK